MTVTVGITRDDGQRHGAVVLGDVGSRIAAVAVIDEAAAHAGGILHASHGAVDVVVALQGSTVVVPAYDGTVAVVEGGGDGGAGGEVVGQDAATAIKACYDTVVLAFGGTVGDGEGGGAGAVADGAETRIIGSTVVAYDAAEVANIVPDGVDGDGAEDVTAGDGAAGVSAYDATGAAMTSDAGVGEGQVVDVGAKVCITEEALIDAVIIIETTDAADGLVVAVEVATESSAVIISDGLVVVLGAGGIVPVGLMAIRDVGGELEELACVVVDCLAVAAIDAAGQQVELLGVVDDVGIVLVAGADGSPVNMAIVARVDADGGIARDDEGVGAVGIAADDAGGAVACRCIVGQAMEGDGGAGFVVAGVTVCVVGLCVGGQAVVERQGAET